MEEKTVLFADDDRALSQALAFRCRQQLGLNARTSPDGLHAYQCITSETPDLLVLDVNMPGAGGLYMCEELARDPRFSTIPVIVLTGQSNPDTVQRCERLGARYVWKGLDTWATLKTAIVEVLGLQSPPIAPAPRITAPARHARTAEDPSRHPAAASSALVDPAKPPTVLLIDDDNDFRAALSVRFRAAGFRVLTAATGTQGFRVALKEQPDAVVTDFKMPDGCGNNVIGDLREHPLTREVPIFVVTGQTHSGRRDYSLERELKCLGATEFFVKPPDFDALLRGIRDRMRTHALVAQLAGKIA